MKSRQSAKSKKTDLSAKNRPVSAIAKNSPSKNLGVFCLGGSWILYNLYFGSLLSGLADAADARGSRLTLYFPTVLDSPDGNPFHRRARLQGLEDLRSGLLAGGVVLGGRDISEDDTRALHAVGRPLVVLNTDLTLPGLFQVHSGADDRTLTALRHLMLKGHRRVGFLGLYEGGAFNQICLPAMEAGSREYGLEFDPGLFEAMQDWDLVNPLDLQERLMNLVHRGATAIICGDVRQAVMGLDLLKSKGLRVPEDMSLISFGPLPEENLVTHPALTLVEADLRAAGARAFDLLEQSAQGLAPSTFRIPWKLGTRGGSVSTPSTEGPPRA